jgi:hypothetical protein
MRSGTPEKALQYLDKVNFIFRKDDFEMSSLYLPIIIIIFLGSGHVAR